MYCCTQPDVSLFSLIISSFIVGIVLWPKPLKVQDFFTLSLTEMKKLQKKKNKSCMLCIYTPVLLINTFLDSFLRCHG